MHKQMVHWLVAVPILAVLSIPVALAAQTTPAPPTHPPAAEQAAIRAAGEQDHQRMMDLLGIKELRPGASGDVHASNAANYDEAKADTHLPLPHALVLADGKPVTSAQMWWTERRPQIVELFNHDILGIPPPHLPAVAWQVASETREKIGDVPVITKKLVGHVNNASDPAIAVDIDLTLTTPANAKGPVPVIMQLTFSREFMAELLKHFPQFAPPPGPTGEQQILARGWGYAEYVPTSVQPDNGAGLTEGIIGLANHGQPRKPDDWGALRAWAWGASRALDYFETDSAVDAHQVGIAGHSRYGKAALVAMAYDRRFAIAYISSSGEGGAKLYRHDFGEQIGNLAGSAEYHWMAGNFLKYDGPLTLADLPIDAHELIALCAPRPVFIGAGLATPSMDGWADAEGMFDAAVAAGPVYRLLGKRDLGTTTFPPVETPLIAGDIAFRQHTGGHTPAPNWPTFLDFASRYLHIKSAPVLADASKPALE